MVQEYAPSFKNVKVDDARGTAFDLLERQIYEDAKREARHPTNIPDGELREIKQIDRSGREISEFYGSPKTWLDWFGAPKKKLVGIRNDDSGKFVRV